MRAEFQVLGPVSLLIGERQIDLDVDHGQLDGPIEELAELTARYPLRESLWVRQLRLLDRSGRRAEALERYAQIRELIADQLGSDPGAPLRAVYADLLADPVADAVVDVTSAPRRTPHQLPPDLRVFAGRLESLQTLDTMLADAIAYATDLAESASPWSMARAKEQVYADLELGSDEALTRALALMDESFDGHDLGEALAARADKRPPRFDPL